MTAGKGASSVKPAAPRECGRLALKIQTVSISIYPAGKGRIPRKKEVNP